MTNEEENNARDIHAEDLDRKPYISSVNLLDIPEDVQQKFEAKGYKLRWINFIVNGVENVSNVSTRFREGYTFVRPEEVAGTDLDMIATTDNRTRYGNLVTYKDLALAKVTIEANEARKRATQRQTDTQEEYANRTVLGHVRREIINESKSSVTGGKGIKAFKDD